MVKRFITRYNNLKMTWKLFITYLCLLIVPFGVFYFFTNHAMSEELEAQALYSSQKNFEQELNFLEYKVESLRTFMNVVVLNEKIQEILQKDPLEYIGSYGVWGFDLEEIRRQYFNSGKPGEVSAIRMYLHGSLPTITETHDFLDFSKAEDSAWYARLENENETFQWTRTADDEDGEPQISALRKIQNSSNIRETMGILQVSLPESTFREMLDRASPFQSSMAFIINREGDVLSMSSATGLPDTVFAADMIASVPVGELKEGLWEKAELENGQYIIGIQQVGGTDWNMVVAVPYGEIFAARDRSLKYITTIFLVMIPLLLPLAYLGGYSGTRRIRKLIAQMRKIEKGDIPSDTLPESSDEIGELTHNFNHMQARISVLLKEQYLLGQENKALEMKALQTQINPHFLYNTLDLIYWKAIRLGEDDIQALTMSLSKFYKLSLSNGRDIVSLTNEIEHVKTYVDIQNARFSNKITLIIDVPEEHAACKLPKITLQPLVENAILHGIMETARGSGRIWITCAERDGRLVVSVKDDGVGIPPEALTYIMNPPDEGNKQGYGVYNIHKRIQLLYGEASGLSFESGPEYGTTVHIEIPLQAHPPNASFH